MELRINRSGLVVPTRTDPRGVTGPSPRQARGASWTRVGRGLYRPAGVADTVAQRIVDAVAAMPEGSAATGWAALHWLGARWSDGMAADSSPRPVPVAVGDRHARRRRPGVVVSEDWLLPGDVMLVDGLPVTIPVRSVTYEARVADGETSALVAIEMAMYDDLVSLAELRAYTARLVSRPGKRRLEAALDAAEENVWSPMETVMRRAWQEHRNRQLRCNQPVFDLAGNHLVTPDLLDVEAGVAGEYDGSVHDSGRRRSRDLAREELMRRLGIEVVIMVAGRGEQPRLHHRISGAYERAGRTTGPRLWTIEQPRWWVDTSTVSRRRDLDPILREHWLGHRRTGRIGRETA
ncbi:hypothetical protein ACFQ3F_23835 [Nocardioides ginsengisoli]|uniref:DUF559 domain-containing protein n=1 Tax=Nocardioides ginsengisoli TaxID=363868 RepID=A0ABW3W6D0_9ACTN